MTQERLTLVEKKDFSKYLNVTAFNEFSKGKKYYFINIIFKVFVTV